MGTIDSPLLLSERDTARLIGFSSKTLRKARSTGVGDFPPAMKINRSVRYRRESILEWIDAHEQGATSGV
jgi:predicted DNA-binding transcriptional regulator AlpA